MNNKIFFFTLLLFITNAVWSKTKNDTIKKDSIFFEEKMDSVKALIIKVAYSNTLGAYEKDLKLLNGILLRIDIPWGVVIVEPILKYSRLVGAKYMLQSSDDDLYREFGHIADMIYKVIGIAPFKDIKKEKLVRYISKQCLFDKVYYSPKVKKYISIKVSTSASKANYKADVIFELDN